jgi:hypothetical protein
MGTSSSFSRRAGCPALEVPPPTTTPSTPPPPHHHPRFPPPPGPCNCGGVSLLFPPMQMFGPQCQRAVGGVPSFQISPGGNGVWQGGGGVVCGASVFAGHTPSPCVPHASRVLWHLMFESNRRCACVLRSRNANWGLTRVWAPGHQLQELAPGPPQERWCPPTSGHVPHPPPPLWPTPWTRHRRSFWQPRRRCVGHRGRAGGGGGSCGSLAPSVGSLVACVSGGWVEGGGTGWEQLMRDGCVCGSYFCMPGHGCEGVRAAGTRVAGVVGTLGGIVSGLWQRTQTGGKPTLGPLAVVVCSVSDSQCTRSGRLGGLVQGGLRCPFSGVSLSEVGSPLSKRGGCFAAHSPRLAVVPAAPPSFLFSLGCLESFLYLCVAILGSTVRHAPKRGPVCRGPNPPPPPSPPLLTHHTPPLYSGALRTPAGPACRRPLCSCPGTRYACRVRVYAKRAPCLELSEAASTFPCLPSLTTPCTGGALRHCLRRPARSRRKQAWSSASCPSSTCAVNAFVCLPPCPRPCPTRLSPGHCAHPGVRS